MSMFTRFIPNPPFTERRESMVTKWVGGACKVESEYSGTMTHERRLDLAVTAGVNPELIWPKLAIF